MFNLKFALSYFLHQLKAINRHGLHSPFVYRLVDEVIYDFSDKKVYNDLEKALHPHKKLNAADKLLYRLIADWQTDSVIVIGECLAVDRIILEHAAAHVMQNDGSHQRSKKDLPGAHTVIFVDAAVINSSQKEELQYLLNNLQEGELLLIKNNHQNSTAEALWKQMKIHPCVTVSVDLFYLGLIYHRPGQVKEDFLIKF